MKELSFHNSHSFGASDKERSPITSLPCMHLPPSLPHMIPDFWGREGVEGSVFYRQINILLVEIEDSSFKVIP